MNVLLSNYLNLCILPYRLPPKDEIKDRISALEREVLYLRYELEELKRGKKV